MIAALLGWFVSAFSWLGTLLGSLVSTVWALVQGILDVLGAVLVTVVGQLFAWLSVLVFGLLGMFTALMPEVSDPGGVSGLLGALAEANRYLPISEAFALLPIWAAIFLGVTLYKGWKALPFT